MISKDDNLGIQEQELNRIQNILQKLPSNRVQAFAGVVFLSENFYINLKYKVALCIWLCVCLSLFLLTATISFLRRLYWFHSKIKFLCQILLIIWNCKYIKEINFRQINFHANLFSRMQVGHNLREFVFAGREMLVISSGTILAITQYVLITSHALIFETEKLIAKLS